MDVDEIASEHDRRLEEPGPSRWSLAAAVVVLVAIAAYVVSVVVTLPSSASMPSLFARGGADAERLLTAAGYQVQLRPFPECEPVGQVVGSEPKPGETLTEGQSVSVFTAVPTGSNCARRPMPRGSRPGSSSAT